jgi:hypothetical protein
MGVKGAGMSKNDTLNTVLNTLTYLEASSANSKLGRLEREQNRAFMQARSAAYAQQRAIDQVYGFRKQFDQVANDSGANPLLRFLQAELLMRDLFAFDEHDLPDLQSREYFLDLQTKVEQLRSQLEAQVGEDGQARVLEFIDLPPLIESSKRDHVYVEALSAAQGAWALSGPMTALLFIALLCCGAGAGLAYYWHTEISQFIDGNTSYRIAPLLVWGGLSAVVVLIALRIFARIGAKHRINAARKRVGITEKVPLLSAKESMKRAGESVRQSIKLGSDSGPYAYDGRTREGLLDSIKQLEKRFESARDAIFSGR